MIAGSLLISIISIFLVFGTKRPDAQGEVSIISGAFIFILKLTSVSSALVFVISTYNFMAYYNKYPYVWDPTKGFAAELCRRNLSNFCKTNFVLPPYTVDPEQPLLALKPNRSGPLYMVTPAGSPTPFTHRFKGTQGYFFVRDGTSANHLVVGKVRAGDCIRVTKNAKGWAQVVLPYRNSFVHVFTEAVNLIEMVPTNRCPL
jgi:hypothetical protein